jgi:hypothetical protein
VASIAFAYAGLELCAVMGGEVKDPKRTLAEIDLRLRSFHRVSVYRRDRITALASVPAPRCISSRGSSRPWPPARATSGAWPG